MDSYAKFMELAMKPKETGAYLRQSVFYFKEKVNISLTRVLSFRVSHIHPNMSAFCSKLY